MNSDKLNIFNEVTAVNKDKILILLSDKLKPNSLYYLSNSELENEIGISIESINTILHEFEELGLIEYNGRGSSELSLSLTYKIYNFRRLGGFVVQEEIIIHNLSKALDEIEEMKKSLSPDLIAKISIVSTLISNVASTYTALNSK